MLKTNKKQFLPAIVFAAVCVVISLICAFLTDTAVRYNENIGFTYQETQNALAIIRILKAIILSVAVIVFSLKVHVNSKKDLTKLLAFFFVFQVIYIITRVYIDGSSYLGPLLLPILLTIPLLISSVKCNKPFAIVILVLYCCSWLLMATTRIAMLSVSSHRTSHVLFCHFVYFLEFLIYDLMFLYPWYITVGKKCLKATVKIHTPSVKKKITITEDDLEALKAKYDAGLITDDEYQQKKAEIMSKL